MKQGSTPQAVCFDAYGTLCRIEHRRDPYRALFQTLGVAPRVAAHLAMTSPQGLEELARTLAPDAPCDPVSFLRDLEAEVNSITLFEDVTAALDRLKRLGLKLWVASNLAPPYATPLREALDGL